MTLYGAIVCSEGHIEYVITLTKTLSDGTKTQDLREVFPGKERSCTDMVQLLLYALPTSSSSVTP